ncbi:MAG: hypothetical protein V1663_00050 [archaeon]
MNKKGITLLEIIIAFVISIILVFVLFKVINAIIPGTSKDDSTIKMFSDLGDDIDNMIFYKEDNVSSLFSISENYVLLGFNNDSDFIEDSNCDVPRIEKRSSCKGKGCLCLCDKGLFDNKDINTCKEGLCYELKDYSFIDTNSECSSKIFFLKGSAIVNLFIEQEGEVIDIHKQ